MTHSSTRAVTVLMCASAILALSLGIRHSFGLFLLNLAIREETPAAEPVKASA